jgi:hypothetical protein
MGADMALMKKAAKNPSKVPNRERKPVPKFKDIPEQLKFSRLVSEAVFKLLRDYTKQNRFEKTQ